MKRLSLRNNRLQVKTLGKLPGKLWNNIGKNPIVFKSNQLHVVIFWYFLHWIEVYSMNSSKVMGYFPEPLNLNSLFLKPNRFICEVLFRAAYKIGPSSVPAPSFSGVDGRVPHWGRWASCSPATGWQGLATRVWIHTTTFQLHQFTQKDYNIHLPLHFWEFVVDTSNSKVWCDFDELQYWPTCLDIYIQLNNTRLQIVMIVSTFQSWPESAR